MGFWWGKLRGRGHLESLGVDGRTVFERTFRNSVGVLYSIDLAQKRDRRQALVNAVNKLRVP
jgi:hypothetical protein